MSVPGKIENAPEVNILEDLAWIMEGIKNLKIRKVRKYYLLTWLHQADRSVIKCVPRKNYEFSNDRSIVYQDHLIVQMPIGIH